MSEHKKGVAMKNNKLIERLISVCITIILFVGCTAVSNTELVVKANDWSSWSEVYPTQSNIEIESRKEYRYKDRISKKSTSTPTIPTGYYLESSLALDEYTSWSGWSGWSKTIESSSNIKEVETKTVTDSNSYVESVFYYYKSPTALAYSYYDEWGGKGVYYQYIQRSYDSLKMRVIGSYNGKTKYYIGTAGCNFSSECWFLKSERTIPAVTHKEYRYRTRNQYYEYRYWPIDFSNWSTNIVSSSNSRVVETRTVYRYRLKSSINSNNKTNNKRYVYNDPGSLNRGGSTNKLKKKSIKELVIKKAKSPRKQALFIKWKKVKGVSGYQVLISKSKRFNNWTRRRNYKNKITKFLGRKIKSGTVLFIKARTYKKKKGRIRYGNWSKVKRVRIK